MSDRMIFVYGTLKRGYGLNRILTEKGAKFIAEGRTVDKFTMLAAGYPVVVRQPALARVAGEIWSVPETLLPDLDRIEGGYNRERVRVIGGGHVHIVDMYIGKPSEWHVRMMRHVPGADGLLNWPDGNPEYNRTDAIA